MKQQRGFTLIEVVVVITLLSLIAAAYSNYLNVSDTAAKSNASKLIADITSIENSFGIYNTDKGAYPTGLTDTSFVPTYLFVPTAPTRWDTNYGVSGYNLGQQNGQPSPNNGYYVCARTTVTGVTDTNWLALGYISQKLSVNNFFCNTSCPATSNMGTPGGATTIFITYWLTRT